MVLASRPSTAVMCQCTAMSSSIAQTVATKVQRCEDGYTAIEDGSARSALSRLQRDSELAGAVPSRPRPS